MITLFRRIRQKLIDSGSVTKYLLYAVGEVLLVVIGILIALQINNWNEYRKERAMENDLLMQLQSEYQNNLDQLDEKITMRNNMIQASIKLLDYIDNPELRNPDSTYAYIGQTTLNPTFDPIVNDIISSGRIQLIQNDELRERLTRFTSDVVQVTEEEELWTNYSITYYRSTLQEFSNVRTLINQYWENDLFSLFQLDGDMGLVLDIGDSKNSRDLNVLLNNAQFEANIASCLSLAQLTNRQSISLRARIVDILTIIESELSSD